MTSLIRETVADISSSASLGLRILYGGSVNVANIKDYMAKANVDGALVGGASLDPDKFASIVRYRI
jgi:triosephosphate isomerase